uniref:Uncharacterized protein n=1 Tax=Cacopsylla melanoneura TaxID=428564 RepID=A0A8D8UIY6_9HEMI
MEIENSLSCVLCWIALPKKLLVLKKKSNNPYYFLYEILFLFLRLLSTEKCSFFLCFRKIFYYRVLVLRQSQQIALFYLINRSNKYPIKFRYYLTLSRRP